MLRNIKLLRQELGISQQRLADALSVSQQSINQYENHDIEPDIQMLTKLADFFDTSVDYIIGHTNIRRKIEETEPYQLNEEESAIIAQYRKMSANKRACLQTMLKAVDTLK